LAPTPAASHTLRAMTNSDDQDRRTRELEVLAESSRLLTATLDLGEVLDRLAGIARRRLDVDVARIWLLDDSGEALQLRAQQGVVGVEPPGKGRLPLGASLCGWVASRRAARVLPGVQTDPRLN